MRKCPVCSGAGNLFGALGLLRWFRCRDCGIDFSKKARARKRRASMAVLWGSTGSGRIELSMTLEQAQGTSHPGPCDMDVLALSREASIASQLAAIDPVVLRQELREYGAWDESQLADHRENLQRILWLLANDIAEKSI